MRFTRENRTLCNELIESKPINTISNGAQEKNYIYEVITLYSYKFGSIPTSTKIQMVVRTNSRKY